MTSAWLIARWVGSRTHDRLDAAPAVDGLTLLARDRVFSRVERPDRPELDATESRHGVLARDLDRLVKVAAVDDVEPRDPLLRLGERAVGDDDLAAAHAHRRRILDRPQPLAEHVHTARVDLVDPLADVVLCRHE